MVCPAPPLPRQREARCSKPRLGDALSVPSTRRAARRERPKCGVSPLDHDPLLISAARRINRAFARQHGRPRRGTVFPDRYHERVLSSPRQCRNAICYVLNNFRRHGEDRFGPARAWKLDPLSSAIRFSGWRELAGADYLFERPPDYAPLPTSLPQTWLLDVGWQRHGLIGTREVPGPADRV